MIIPATLDSGITVLCGLQGLKGNVYLVKRESEKKKSESGQEGERECKKRRNLDGEKGGSRGFPLKSQKLSLLSQRYF